MLQFVGDDRRALVDELVDIYGRLSESGPVWVSMEATTGWGKTRIVQEFYRRLAAGQGESGYWPASIEGSINEIGTVGLNRRRNAVYPELVNPPARALPEWMWWGVSCHRGSGEVWVQSIAGDLTQFKAHEDALERAWKNNARLRQRFFSFTRRNSGLVGENAINETIGQAAALADLAFPGVGLVVSLSQTAVRRAVENHRLSNSQMRDATGEPRPDLVDQLAPAIAQIGRVLPIVIVVEDFHDADASLVALLMRALRSEGAAVLLVTTAWPNLLNEPGRPCSQLVASIPPGVRHRWQQPIETESTEDRLTTLARASRERLVADLLPDTAGQKVVAAIADQYQVPLALEVVTALPETLDAVADGLDPAEWVGELPGDLRSLYRVAFKALPEAVRDRLMLAALAARPGGGFPAEQWDEQLLSAAALTYADTLDSGTDVVRAAAAAEGVVPGWVEDRGAGLRRFLEPVQLEVADSDSRQRHRHRLPTFYAALAGSITVADPGDDHTDSQLAAAELLVALHTAGYAEPSAQWNRAVVVVCQRCLDDPDNATTRRGLQVAIKAVPHLDGPNSLTVRGITGRLSVDVGEYRTAITWFEQLLPDLIQVLGADAPDTLGTRNDLARAYLMAGQVGEAITGLEQLLPELERVLGADSAYALTTRNDLAYAYKDAGRLEEAITRFEGLLDDRVRMQGADAPGSLTTGNNLGLTYRDAGRIEEAISIFETLVPVMVRVLGADAQNTLGTRNNLALACKDAGRIEEAVSGFERLLVDQLRVLGPDAPDTLLTRNNLTSSYKGAGRLEEAVVGYEHLLIDQLRVLGADAPPTLTTRNNLALVYRDVGRVQEAITRFEQLLPELERVLGVKDPVTQSARYNLGLAYHDVGQV